MGLWESAPPYPSAPLCPIPHLNAPPKKRKHPAFRIQTPFVEGFSCLSGLKNSNEKLAPHLNLWSPTYLLIWDGVLNKFCALHACLNPVAAPGLYTVTQAVQWLHFFVNNFLMDILVYNMFKGIIVVSNNALKKGQYSDFLWNVYFFEDLFFI